MKKYPKYKDSGIEWIGEIPVNWKVNRLKLISEVIPSNIDKKTKEDEEQVKLCNYVDVYKNEYITEDIDFMIASASENQIYKLTLKKNDVIATKDSEDPNDIGVPALVIQDLDNVVCGYHLTLFRSIEKNDFGRFLFWFLKSNMCSQYFSTMARGVTRYALGTSAFKNLPISLSFNNEEIIEIANYLDRKTSEINTLITNKEKLIELLKEERTAIINHAVTKGINPKAKLKPSGVEWIGDIPEHWELNKLKYILKTTKGYAFKSELFIEKGVPVVKASDIKDKSVRIDVVHYIDKKNSKDYESVKLSSGDIIISTVGSTPDVINSAVGQIGKVPKELDGALLNQNTVRLEIYRKTKMKNDYLFFLIQNDNYRSFLNLHAHGTANQASLKLVDILKYEVALPTIEEQGEIINFIESKTSEIDTIISKTEKEIELLNEYKTALISEVVTGKVDVREEVYV